MNSSAASPNATRPQADERTDTPAVDVGAHAKTPWQMPWRGWVIVLKRTWAETTADNIGLIAAGVAFYGFLALVPLLGAVVLVYGLVADAATVTKHVGELAAVLPGDAAKLIGDLLLNVVGSSDGKKGIGLLLAFAVALFGARNGAGALVTALNIAYEEEEKRSFLAVNALSLAITAASVATALVAMFAIATVGFLTSLLPTAPDWLVAVGKVAAYGALAIAGAAGAATLFRYGPSRQSARWVWLTPGSLLASGLWIALTLGFGVYVANFGNYDATYGSLGAVIVLLTWMYLSSYVLLLGAELNAELEHQTADDTTPRNAPLGARGAWVADHVAEPEAANSALAPLAPVQRPATTTTGPLQSYAAGRAAAAAVRMAKLGRVGGLVTLTATVGLSQLRRPGRAPAGAALLLASGVLAWLGRPAAAGSGKAAVLFDLDGTLIDSNPSHIAAWSDAFREAGHGVSSNAIAAQIGKGGDQLVPALLPTASTREVQKLSDRQGEIFRDRYLAGVRPFAQADALLRRLHGAGVAIAFASSAARWQLDHYIRLLGVGDILDVIVTADDVRTSKPAGDIFATALRQLDIDGGSALAVGDTPYDAEAAGRVGLATIAVRSGGFSDAVLSQSGVVAIYDDVAALLENLPQSPLATLVAAESQAAS